MAQFFVRLADWYTRHFSAVERWLIIAVCGAVAAVMLIQLPSPYWFDEANTIFYVQQPFWRMLAYVANDWFPPAYYVLLRLWVALFGSSEAATGSLSLIFAVVTALLVYGLGRQLFGPIVGRRAAVLFWVSEGALYWATETRMYMLLMALAVASTWLLANMLQRRCGWRTYGAYGALVLLGGYTHYPFWFFVVAQNVGVLVWQRLHPSYLRSRRWIAVQLLVGLCYLPQVAVLYDRVTNWYLDSSYNWLDNASASLPMFWRLPLELLIRTTSDVPFWVPRVILWLVVSALVLTVVQFTVREGTLAIRIRASDPAMALLFPLMLVPLFILYGLNVGFGRYASFILPFLSLLLALGVSRLHRPLLQHALFAGIFVSIASLNAALAMATPLHDQDVHWPEVRTLLASQAQTPNTAIVAHYQDAVLLDYYYDGPLPIVRLPWLPTPDGHDQTLEQIRNNGRQLITSESLHNLGRQLSGMESVWLVRGSGAMLFDNRRLMNAALAKFCQISNSYEIPADPGLDLKMLWVQRYTRCHFVP